ncbi:Nardilysin [Eumeta japonica]|uniref:Nardilysin n=1 Tax=Eumeta variegata TaxID=151549 RepID=A0A4C1VJS5_EUMVA|nr:Nardilysin [Eumeta japonica]
MSKRSINQKSGNRRPFNIKTKQPFSMPVRKEKVEVLTEPIKSESDKKVYRTIRLENGLTALLISDPSRLPPTEESSSEEESLESGSDEGSDHDASSVASASSDNHATKRRPEFDEEKLAACALCVGVGSYSDPPALQGLAHFVEHMVFMGSGKYPKENEFDAFIKKKGGSDNAATDCEQTTFYFEIEEKYLLQAMDMFSQFFVDPLMLKESMQREREAIESDHFLVNCRIKTMPALATPCENGYYEARTNKSWVFACEGTVADDNVTATECMIDDGNESEITMDGIMKALTCMKVGKAAGYDKSFVRDAVVVGVY